MITVSSKQPRKNLSGFTLIELLVVIAIIAILAAILFPVFAKVRQKARQSTSLSNEKQIGLAFMQYTQDADETFPTTSIYLFGDPSGSTWVTKIYPYIKSDGVFKAPEDGGPTNANFSWCGSPISYSVNGYQKTPATNATNGIVALGNSWATGAVAVKIAAVTQPSDSIMMAEHFSSDVHLSAQGFPAGNYPQNWPTNIFLGSNYPDYAGWATDIPNDTATTPTGTWPLGPDGGVTAHYGGDPLKNAYANFLFVDGHAKSMRPAATNPDPAHHPELNMWDTQRS